ncbi:MAG: tetratricopeptide repeat protein, partial [Chitinispirillaceae bacterium]|nr:tetratricopeptide repeat protein [Chitinispirillaceae bacterium]
MRREIIAGRTSLKRSVREYLIKLLDEGRETRSFIPFKKIKEPPILPPSIYLIHGEEGIGKTTLLNYCLAIAEEVAEEIKKDIRTFFIDLEEINYLKASLPPSPLDLMNFIAEYFSTVKDSIAQKFTPYNKMIENYLRVLELSNEYLLRNKIEQTLQKINIDTEKEPQEKKDTNESEIEVTTLSSKESQVESELSRVLSKEEMDLYRNGEKKLAEYIVSAITSAAEETPIFLAFDNYNYLPAATEEWFRKEILKKIIEKKNKVIFIIGGNRRILRKFRNEFAEESIFAVNLSDITLTKNTISLLASKLHINLSENDAELIEKYSAGIPLIVNDILFYISKGISLNEIIEKKENEISNVEELSLSILERFLTKCNDNDVRHRLFSIAMLTQFNSKILSELWGIPPTEIKNALSFLEESVSFVKDSIIHPFIRKILHNSLLQEAAKGSQSNLRSFFVNFSTVCVKVFKEQLNQLYSAIPYATQRCKDERYLSTVEQLICGIMWSSPTDAFVSLPAYYLELIHFNPEGAKRILSRLEEFRYLFSPINEKTFKNLKAGFSLVDRDRIINQILPESFEEELVSYIEPLSPSMNDFQRALFLHIKGSLGLRKGNLKEALDLLNSSFSIVGNLAPEKTILYPEYAVLGTMFYKKEDYRNCIESFSNAVLIYADSFIPWYTMGISRMTIGEYEGAVNALSEAVKIDPSHPDAWYNLGLSYVKINQFIEAVNSFIKATQLTPDRAIVWFELGKAYVVLKQHNEAVNALRKVVELEKENAEAWLLLGQSCSILGLSEEAIEAYNKSIEIKPKSIEGLKALGREYLKLKRFEEAVSTFTKATRISKKDPELWSLISESHYGASQYEKAIEAAEKVIEIDNNNIYGWEHLGNAYMKIGKFDEAIEAFKKCVGIEEDNAEVWLKLGTIYNDKKEYDLAIAAFRKAVAYNPALKEVWYTIGLAYEVQDKFAEAIAAYDRGTKADPQNYECWDHKGNMYVKLEQYEDAFECYSQVVKINPSLINSWFKRGIAATKVENFKEAINSFAKVVEIEPSNTEGWYQLGLAYKRIGDQQEAIRSFTEAVSQNDQRSEIWRELGDSCMSLGIFEEAITAYE